MTTAIIGVGTMGSRIARRLAAGGEPLVLAAREPSRADALADELGPTARAASVDDAIAGADTVIVALWLDALREVIPKEAGLLDNKVVIDPSNPVGFDESGKPSRTLPDGESSGSVVAAMLPASAHYVKAFGTFGADDFFNGAHREPLAVLFYATDDDIAAITVERLIRVAGYEPVKAGGVADALRIEFFGDLNSRLLDVDEAHAAVAADVPA
jgi:8-hydroxy-5-deazaflavin:NADPH oxidoreductase